MTCSGKEVNRVEQQDGQQLSGKPPGGGTTGVELGSVVCRARERVLGTAGQEPQGV